jgi:hypothetical protein
MGHVLACRFVVHDGTKKGNKQDAVRMRPNEARLHAIANPFVARARTGEGKDDPPKPNLNVVGRPRKVVHGAKGRDGHVPNPMRESEPANGKDDRRYANQVVCKFYLSCFCLLHYWFHIVMESNFVNVCNCTRRLAVFVWSFFYYDARMVFLCNIVQIV